jgi:hypothetical protein
MTPEDRLRDILKGEAAAIMPAGDGLALIRERVARRRRLRLLAVPGGALVTAAAVVAVFALTGPPANQSLVGPPAEQPTATPTATTEPTQAPTAPPLQMAMVSPYRGPALWPFTSAEQGRAWMNDHGARPWAQDPLAVAQHFVDDLLKLDSVTASGTAPNVTLTVPGPVASKQVGVVHVVRTFEGGPWTVVSVCCTDLTITTPEAGTAITSPTEVSGRITGVDENVQLRLITATGRDLASTGAPAGTEMPWQGSLTWTDQDWFTAGIVAITRSPRDGTINRIAVVVVKRGQP